MSKQSREAFLDQLRSGKYATNQAKVFQVLSNVAALNLQELRDHFSGNRDAEYMPHQTLTATLSSLCDMGVIAQNPTNGYFFRTPEHVWDDCAKRRKEDKYKKWVKKGQEMGWHHRYTRDRINEDGLFWDNFNQV